MARLPPNIARIAGHLTDYSAGKEVGKVQKALFPPFKDQGFVSKGRTFNRSLADGLVQMVHFNVMLPFSTQYGQFAFEVGVFLPEVWAVRRGGPRPDPIDAHAVELRIRLKPPSMAANTPREWDALVQPDVISQALDTVVPQAMAFFDRFQTRDRIRAELSASDADPHRYGPAQIILAIMEWHSGQSDLACRRLETHLAGIKSRGDGHAAYLRGLIQRLSHEAPAP